MEVYNYIFAVSKNNIRVILLSDNDIVLCETLN